MVKDKDKDADAGKEEEPVQEQEPVQTEKAAAAASARNITEITGTVIEDLGAKLDEFGRSLSDDEQTVLATALTLAGRGFGTLLGQQACIGEVNVGLGRNSISVERRAGSPPPKLAGALEAAFCPGKASRFSIEGLEVDRTVYGAKSVAAGACQTFGLAAAKSVAAAACRFPGAVGSKSVAATACRTGLGGAKSVAAAAKSVAAAAKSVAAAACRYPGAVGSKSVAAAACRTPGALGVGSKSVAAACRNPGFYGQINPGLVGAKSTAACRIPGFGGQVYPGYGAQFMSGAFCRG
jgi:hypothetical protein